MVLVTLVAPLIFLCAVQAQYGNAPERTCATLFSRENFGGESLPLYDSDEYNNLKTEYRHSRGYWTDTKSIRVENGCTISACAYPYHTGQCQSFTSSRARQSEIITTVKSVKCNCDKHTHTHTHSTGKVDAKGTPGSSVGGSAQGTSAGKGGQGASNSKGLQEVSDAKGIPGSNVGRFTQATSDDNSSNENVLGQPCATLFTRENFGGEPLALNALDKFANLKVQRGHSGWTNSIQVENGCTITACDNTYFQGKCQPFTLSQAKSYLFLTNVKSASCDCEGSSYGNEDDKPINGSNVGGLAKETSAGKGSQGTTGGKASQGTSDDKGSQGTGDGKGSQGTGDGKGSQGTGDGVQSKNDQSSLGTTDKDCGCTAIITQMQQKIDKLEAAVERTERLIDADRIKADIWEELKLKWIKHFEL